MIVPCPIVFPPVFTSKDIKLACLHLTHKKNLTTPIPLCSCSHGSQSLHQSFSHEKASLAKRNLCLSLDLPILLVGVHATQNTLMQLYLHCGEVYVENKHKPKLNLHQSVRQQRIQNFNRAHCPVSLRYLRCINPQERMPSYRGTWTTSTSPRQMWPSLKAPGPYLRNMSPG